MYNVLYNATFSYNRVINWASIINSLRFGHVGTEQFVADELYFITLCRQRLCDQYMVWTKWSCILYNDLHFSFSFSEYLNITMPLEHTITLRTKKHITALLLFLLNRGRNRLVFNARLCSTCGVLGDEYLCIFKCLISDKFRHILPKHFVPRSNMIKNSYFFVFSKPSIFVVIYYFLMLSS